jgi:AmpD protein
MEIREHWITTATQIPSPNCSERSLEGDISLLVIHCISLPPGDFGGPWIDALFCNSLDAGAHPYFAGICTLRVSAHLLIRRDGSLVQYVPFDRMAWHAGRSSYQGREGCNDFSIGIELEGTEELPFSADQYLQLQAVTRLLLQTYSGLSVENIAGHSDIAPGRKTDPGPCFDWPRYRSALPAA